MRVFLTEHLDFVYLIYGMTFIFLAMMAGSMARRRGAGPEWRYLCAFGIIHGVNEWLDMMAPVVGTSDWFSVFRGTVLTASFLCLFEFGRRSVRYRWKWKAGSWLYLPIFSVMIYGVRFMPEDCIPLIRISLGLPGGLLAAFALWKNGVVIRHDEPIQRREHIVAALAMAGYALSTGLIIPPAHFWPANHYHSQWFMDVTGVPVQVVRFLMAALVVLAIWYDYDRWRFRTHQADFTRRVSYVRWVTLLSVSVVMVSGWVLVERADHQCREDHEGRLLSLSRGVAAAINPKEVLELKGDPSDLRAPAFLYLQRQCHNICDADPAIRYVYLMALRENTLRFLLDVEPARYAAESVKPNAVPGEIYTDAPPEILQVFKTGTHLVSAPYYDAWGMFISGYAPIRDPITGDVMAVIGIDTSGLQWLSDISHARLLRLLLTGGAILLLLLFAVMWQREIEESQVQHATGQRMQLQQSALLGIANSPFVADGNIFMMARTVTQVTAEVIGVERVELWLKGKEHEKFRAENIYLAGKGAHSSGQFSGVTEGSPFLNLMESGRVTPSSNFQEDERFGVMRDEWGRDIRAVLVAPLRVSGRLTGWLTAVQTGRCRNWLTDEMRFIAEMADQVVHTLNNNDRQLAAAAQQRAHDELEQRVRERTEALSRKNEELSKEISERLRMEREQRTLHEKMQQSQKLESLGLMAGGIAHDFNNILMAVLGNVELARLETPVGTPVYEYLQDIDKASCRAAELARQMLIYSGRGHATVQGIELNDMVRDMTSMLKVSLGKRIQIAYELEQGVPSVDGDLTQMRQVLMNLIINASEAIGKESGRITVRTGVIQYDQQMIAALWLKEELSAGKYVFMDVIDTGCGMDETTVRRIFDPFFTTKFTGRGLGLAAVLGIIKGHNGAIDVTSQKGKGTQFRIILPIGRRGGGQERAAPDGDILAWRGEGTILLADDEPTIRALAHRLLERSGFSVLDARDGNEAIEIFKQQQHRICCVLLDLTMPDVNGKEAFDGIRQIDPAAKIILCSGYMEENMAMKFPDWNVSGFLQKPYKYEALVTLLRKIVTG